MKVLGVDVPSPVTKALEINKQAIEQAATAPIQDTLNNPKKNIQELQSPSVSLGQFINFKM